MVDANDLILFVRVVDAGSFSQAAERADLPKSTLSRRLTLLEEALGEKLFVRSTRRVAITAFGERILEHARRLVDETEEVAALALHRQETPRGELRVSMPPDFIESDFAAFCQAFQARYPEIRLRVDLSPRRVDLVSERFDVAVRAAFYLPDDATLVARKLCDVRQGLFASPDYLAEHGTPQTPDDLVRHACLALASNDGETTPWVLTRGDERWEQVVQGPLVCNSPRLQREMALRAAGIAALPADAALRDWIGNGRLRRVLPDWWLPTAGLWCVMPGRRLMPARTRVFVDMLQAHMDAIMSG
ncbi:LysR family transcriptional regulator [Massilia phosphatilytica]|nr:LysR family transcriptional regulator [Massilia phosphatilytica]